MPFAYYGKLSAADQAIYRRSAAVTSLALSSPRLLWPLVDALRGALERDDHEAVQAAAHKLCRELTQSLHVPPVNVEVLAVRPRLRRGAELHGLYTRDPRRRPRIQVWMRTAAQARVVAFRTFLRTLLHEVCHHLDYTLLGLRDSLHTEGFFQRESSLFHQLVTDAAGAPAPAPATPG